MLSETKIYEIDSKQMHKTYNSWPDLATESFQNSFKKCEIKDIDHIVFAGMGGSGTIGDVISSVLSKTNLHTTVVKGYMLPRDIDKNTLVVATSITGNTDETLAVSKLAINSPANFISFSSGGLLENLSIKNNQQHFHIEMNHSPRASLIGYLYSTLNVLEDLLPIKKYEMQESIEKLHNLKKIIDTNNLTNSNPSLNLSYWIKNIPLIYYPWGLQSAAIRFKNSMQENSKNHMIIEDIIEACHNGIVAWEKKSVIQPVLLQGKEDNPKTVERWKLIKEMLNDKGIKYYEIFSESGNILSKLICMIYLLDFSSLYHSVINNIDPTPVLPIEQMKKKLSSS